MEVTRNIIEENHSDGGAGGVYARSYSSTANSNVVLFTDNIVRNNSSSNWAGGAMIASDSISGAGPIGLFNNIITNNESSYEGGGVYVYSYGNAESGQLFIKNNIISGNNSVTRDGGGMYIHVGPHTASNFGIIEMTNNIIAENHADGYGGGLYTYISSIDASGNIFLTHNTITDNHSGESGGGIFSFLSSTGDKFFMLYNNIIWGNSARVDGGDIYFATGDSKYIAENNDYNDMFGTWFSESNSINVNPRFVGGGNYHLRNSSPCRDKGTSNVSLPATDIDGDDRVLFTAPDLGADEITQPYFPWFMFLPALIGPK